MPSCDFGGNCNCVECLDREEEWEKNKNDPDYFKRQEEWRNKYGEMMREERLKKEVSIKQTMAENNETEIPQPETNKEFILKHKHILLTRGKYKGSTYQKAAQDADYISYCRQNAKHNELKNLILYHDKVKELAREIGYKAFFE